MYKLQLPVTLRIEKQENIVEEIILDCKQAEDIKEFM